MSCFTNSPSSVLLLFMSVCSSVSGYINILLSVDRWVRSLEGAWKLNTGTCSIMPLRILFFSFFGAYQTVHSRVVRILPGRSCVGLR